MHRLKITLSATNQSGRKILSFRPQEYVMHLDNQVLISRIGLQDDVDNYLSNNSGDTPDIPYGVNVGPKETMNYSIYFDVPQQEARFVLLTISNEVISFNSNSLSEDDLVFRIDATSFKKD
jgi:hypothetical protein